MDAVKLGLGAWYPWTHVEEYLDHRLRSAGLSLATLKQKGIVRGPAVPVTYEEGVAPAFATPSGKIEFYSTQLRDAGFDPVPRYAPHPEPPGGSFRLLFGRAPVHTFGRTQTNPLLAELMSENEVWVNADAARRLGLADGAWVRLRNQDGVASERVQTNFAKLGQLTFEEPDLERFPALALACELL